VFVLATNFHPSLMQQSSLLGSFMSYKEYEML
jgi:hypothetical protein